MIGTEDLVTIAAHHGRHPPIAYAFLIEALRSVLCDADEACACRGHIAAADLVDGMLCLAAERFGLLAPMVLRSWGLCDSQDIGRITFHLIEHGVLGKQDDDRIEDFSHGPVFTPRIRELVDRRLREA